MFCYNDTSCLTPTTGVAPQTISSALQFFAAATCLISDNWPPDADVRDYEKFDFIIIGGGTTGCVVANRLSENKEWKVLIIEAGHNPPIESKIPAQHNAMYGSEYDWRYTTTYNGITNMANKNNSINWPRGKMLGGCSNINGMLYVKGNRQDYQRWYDAGNKEWHPDIVNKYYQKAESLQNMELLNRPDISKNYGRNGQLVINKFNSTYRPLTQKILSAWNEIGIKNVPDINTANVMGSGIPTVTAYNGVRASSDRMYLKPVVKRSNLKILRRTMATQILINKLTKVAYGIEVQRNDTKKIFLATQEVILCAGTINTPQLLMLSGVGPKEHLRSKNIECIVDLPAVGQNLKDHCTIPVPIFGDSLPEKEEAERSFDAITFLYNHTGDLAQNSFADIVAFYSCGENTTDQDFCEVNTLYPDFQNHLTIFWTNSSTIKQGFSTLFNYEDSIVNHLVELNKNFTLYNFSFNLLHPLSRGNITLKSKDPKDHPIIYANYFTNPSDLDAAVVGIRKISQLLQTKFFKSVNAFLARMDWAPCNKFELNSDSNWRCVCLNMVNTVYHPIGTAKMGPDPLISVVDSRLRVHKMKGLRIIDASVMPNLTSGNTQGPCYMIGERGSDLVKEDHK